MGWHKRISYQDFFDNYLKWCGKNSIPIGEKKEIQDYLERKFAGGRVHLSEKTKTTHLFGVWGLSLKGKNGLQPKKLTRKQVVKCLLSDNSILQTWDSLSIASENLNIPRSTLSCNIRFKKQFENSYYYKFKI